MIAWWVLAASLATILIILWALLRDRPGLRNSPLAAKAAALIWAASLLLPVAPTEGPRLGLVAVLYYAPLAALGPLFALTGPRGGAACAADGTEVTKHSPGAKRGPARGVICGSWRLARAFREPGRAGPEAQPRLFHLQPGNVSWAILLSTRLYTLMVACG